MKLCRTIFVFLVIATVAVAAPEYLDQTWHDAKRNRDVPVRIRMPAGEGPFPVLLISHGLGGSRRGIGYLAEAARDAGWLCVNLQHPGSDESLWRGQRGAGVLRNLKQAIRKPEPALDRLADVSFAIDYLTRANAVEGAFHKRVRIKDLAIAGHSYGAWTVYATAGRRNATARRLAKLGRAPEPERRVRAIIALSPQGEASVAEERASVAAVTVPTLNVTGGNDHSPIQPDMTADRRRYSFDALPAAARPAYLLWFDEADHMVFGGNEGEGRRWQRRTKADYYAKVQNAVATAAVAFLQREVLKDKSTDLLIDPAKSARLMRGLGKVERKR